MKIGILTKKFTRKEFLNYLIGISGAALAGSTLFPLVKYIMPPEGVDRDIDVSQVNAAKVGELMPNSAKIFRFGNKPAILLNTPQGVFKAFSAVCTHLNCTVQYSQETSHIICACHNGHFDLNGKVISGPPPKPLEEYKVYVAGEDIIVSKV
ncbi:MAG: ubiquinol-cytochrome c reductase iron-sulfur subunit [Candidatus Omnitrophota bacterium]